MITAFFNRFVGLLPQLCFGAALLGILLRATLRDSVIGFSTLFYGLPLPVCFAGFVAGTIAAHIFSKRKLLVRIGICLSFVGAVLWLRGSLVKNQLIETTPDLKVAFWNAADNNRVFTRAASMTGTPGPDILVFAETGNKTAPDEAEFKKMLPGFQLVKAPGYVAVAARGTVTLTSVRRHKSKSMLYVFRVKLPGQDPCHIVLADIFPNVLYSRKHVLTEVLMLGGTGPRTLIIGDFNTPYESVWFRPYRERFHHAWQTAGRGLRETWPWPMPALSLDHLWSSPDLVPLNAERRHSWVSDHAMIVVEYRFSPLQCAKMNTKGIP